MPLIFIVIILTVDYYWICQIAALFIVFKFFPTIAYLIGGLCALYFYKGNPFAVYAPTFVELEVIDCEPGIQGDTSKSTTKPAKVETGYILNVPLFVNIGDRIRIDTRDGSYMERVK